MTAPKVPREDEYGAVFITESDYDDKRDEVIAKGRPWDRRDWHVTPDPVIP